MHRDDAASTVALVAMVFVQPNHRYFQWLVRRLWQSLFVPFSHALFALLLNCICHKVSCSLSHIIAHARQSNINLFYCVIYVNRYRNNTEKKDLNHFVLLLKECFMF